MDLVDFSVCLRSDVLVLVAVEWLLHCLVLFDVLLWAKKMLRSWGQGGSTRRTVKEGFSRITKSRGSIK